jgi:PPK2 family polyphosphate:nucleotide phosphotransferase
MRAAGRKKLFELCTVPPGKRVKLGKYDSAWSKVQELKELSKDEIKDRAQAILQENLAELAQAQALLYASDTYSVLLIFQAMDAAGKDGTIKHVMSGVNPQGCQVSAFKVPSAEELDHDFLWRYWRGLPERGRIGIFNRSYYEEVLVVRVHPELLARQRLPPAKVGKSIWKERYDDINAFERHLTRNGTVILKFFLNVSKDEQKKRFLDRLEDSDKHWKFSLADLAERAYWDEYMTAFEDAIEATSTKWAPWYIIPADRKWIARAVVAEIVATTISSLDIAFPKPTKEQMEAIKEAKRKLLAE